MLKINSGIVHKKLNAKMVAKRKKEIKICQK